MACHQQEIATMTLPCVLRDERLWSHQRLVERAVKDDQDLVYGVFVNGEKVTLARAAAAIRSTRPSRRTKTPAELGPQGGRLLVKAPSVKRVTRSDKICWKWRVPVVSEEGEALGTIRYGLSTARMHEALARAKQDSDSRLWRSVLLMVGLVSLVTGLGLVLSRAQTVHITERWGALTKAAEALGQGRSLGARGHQFGDELAVLARRSTAWSTSSTARTASSAV